MKPFPSHSENEPFGEADLTADASLRSEIVICSSAIKKRHDYQPQ
jgi:hypothetical protein